MFLIKTNQKLKYQIRMTRQEHLAFCNKCVNREVNSESEVICALTSNIADFVGECESYAYNLALLGPEEGTENTAPVEPLEVNEDGEVVIEITEDDLNKLRSEQNFPKAVLVGLIAGLIGAIVWAAITVITNYQIGYMAIAVGAGVGFAVKIAGKGIDQKFGITGALIAIISCVLGNFLGIIGYIANAETLGYLETLTLFDYSQFIPIMTETFSGMDLLFYGIAGYEGYKFAFRTIEPEDLTNIQ